MKVNLGGLALTLGQLLSLVTPLLVLWAIDWGILGRDLGLLALLALIGLLVQVAGAGANYVGRKWVFRRAEALGRRARELLLAHMQRQSPLHLQKQAPAELVARVLYETRTQQEYHAAVVPGMIQAAIGIGGTGLALFLIAPKLSLLALIPLPLAVVVARLFKKGVALRTVSVMERFAKLQKLVFEALAGSLTVALFGQEHRYYRAVQREGECLEAEEVAAFGHSAKVSPLLDVAAALMVMSSLWLGGWMVIEASLSLGTLVSFQLYLARAMVPMRSVGNLLVSRQRYVTARARMAEVLAWESGLPVPTQPEPLPVAEAALRFEQVSFSYDEESLRPALDGVDLELSPGEHLAVLGPSGAGKSTLALLMARLADPTQGVVTYDGTPLRAFDLASWRRQVGLVEQTPFLVEGSVEDNVRWGLDEDAVSEDIAWAIATAAVDRIVATKVETLTSPLGPRSAALSGGEKKRVALARALVRRPRILVIDQLGSDLEPDLCRHIFQGLRQVEGLIVLYLGHRLPEGFSPDAVYTLQAGRLHREAPQEGD